MAALLAGCPDDTSPIATTSDTDTDGSSSDGGSITNPTTMSTSLDTTADTTADTSADTGVTVTTTMGTEESSSTDVTDTDASSSSDGGSVCGDDVADKGEECDGTDLAGEDCASQGFDTGTLACAADCTFDTAACASNCGNGTLDVGEDCDGADLDGEDCVSQGFDAGVLACTAACVFDTGSCTMNSCGDNMAQAPEVCDGTDLAGEDCASQGFDLGTLDCAGNCAAFDTSSCSFTLACQDEDIGTATGPAVTSGDTTGDDNDIDATCGSGGGNDRVIGFTATGAGVYTFDTFGSTYDTKLALYSDCTTELACNDDAGGLQSQLVLDLAAGQEILIVVDGYNGGTGPWVLNITEPPVCGDGVVGFGETCDGADLAGQDCVTLGFASGVLACDAMCGAYDTSGCVAAVCGDGVRNGTEACDGADLGGTGCLNLGVPPSGTVSNCCVNSGGLGCDDMTCSDAICALDPYCCATAWDTQCANEAADFCDPDLCPDPTCNGTCDGFGTGSCNTAFTCIEEDIGTSTGPGVSAGSTVGEDEDIAQGCGGGGAVDHVVFFAATAAGSYTFDTFGSTYDTVLSASNDCASTFACNDDAAGGAQSSLTFAMSAGQGVLISVSGYLGSTGNYVLNITPPSASAVEFIGGCDATYCTFTVGAGPNGGDMCSCTLTGLQHPTANDYADATCFGGTPGNDLLIGLDLAGYTQYSVQTCNTNPGDSAIATYDNDPLAGGVQAACSEDATGELGFCSEITDSLSAAPGTPTPVPASGLVYVLVDEWTPVNYWNGVTTRVIDFEAIP